MPATSRRGPASEAVPRKMAAALSVFSVGFGGSPSRRAMVAKPIAPVATGAPLPVTSSTLEVVDRRPCRRTVPVASIRAGAGSARIRTDMSDVSAQASGSVSTTIPATASTRNDSTLIRTTPWCSTSGRARSSRTIPPSVACAVTPSRPAMWSRSGEMSVTGSSSWSWRTNASDTGTSESKSALRNGALVTGPEWNPYLPRHAADRQTCPTDHDPSNRRQPLARARVQPLPPATTSISSSSISTHGPRRVSTSPSCPPPIACRPHVSVNLPTLADCSHDGRRPGPSWPEGSEPTGADWSSPDFVLSVAPPITGSPSSRAHRSHSASLRAEIWR